MDALKKVLAGTKKESVLRSLLERGERGLNRFDAERECHDHTLPSTISELCRQFGLVIPRQLETVPGFQGKPTECSRYRLSPADAVKVRAILGDTERAEAAEAERWQRISEAERREREDRAARGAP